MWSPPTNPSIGSPRPNPTSTPRRLHPPNQILVLRTLPRRRFPAKAAGGAPFHHRHYCRLPRSRPPRDQIMLQRSTVLDAAVDHLLGRRPSRVVAGPGGGRSVGLGVGVGWILILGDLSVQQKSGLGQIEST